MVTLRRRRPGRDVVACAGLVALAVVLRLVGLADRPFHHDESQDAYFSWTFFTTGEYQYQPLLHGPVRFYLTAGAYALFCDSDFTARLVPALVGSLLVPLPVLLREQLGRPAAYAAALLLAVGPSYLYFSRFAREDIYVVLITLALLVVTFRFLASPRRHQPALAGALLALCFATKESTFITVFVAGTFFVAALAWQVRRAGSWREAELVRTVASVGRVPWVWGLVAFLGTYTILFTTFLTNPDGVYGLYTGLDYWLGQQPVGRGGEPWFFYGVVLFAHEWPVLVLGAIGIVAALRRPTLLRVFLVWDFALSLAVYSWASEKFSWLVLHPLLPLLLLAGFGVQTIWDARGRWSGRLGLVVVLVCLLHVGWASWWANAENGANPREFLVATQSADAVKGVRDAVLAADARARREGRDVSILIDSAEGATFPWAWYFRDRAVGYLDLTDAGIPPDTDVAVLTVANRERLRDQLAGYDGRRFPFRVWWVRDYGAMSPRAWWDWFARREPWNETGGMEEWLYLRQGA